MATAPTLQAPARPSEDEVRALAVFLYNCSWAAIRQIGGSDACAAAAVVNASSGLDLALRAELGRITALYTERLKFLHAAGND
ncbi:hypothetical protein ACFYUY_39070 [Kitasatospora sp. NPDC004745]|uniref:hypothetical protein n=1 Tax=unclassified Kitasatospora TaxID=2633591 RepID=UPI0036C2132E